MEEMGHKMSGQKTTPGANFTRPSTAGSMPLALCRCMHNLDKQTPVGCEIENHDRIDLVYRTTRTSGSSEKTMITVINRGPKPARRDKSEIE
jgi:hypothetical protein